VIGPERTSYKEKKVFAEEKIENAGSYEKLDLAIS